MEGNKGRQGVQVKPNYSILALLSFIASFAVARIFTYISPDVVLVGGSFHIHHFWYGLAMLSTGGWIGISYDSERTDRWAAFFFGAGGGLIGDEIGLLLTLGDYWTGITYTAVTILLVLFVVLILITRYSDIIGKNVIHLLHGHPSFYFGVSLVVVSLIFIAERRSVVITDLSTALAFSAGIYILVRQLLRKRAVKRGI